MDELKQRVLVTGGAGRLGLRVCRALLDLGFRVTVFDLPTRRNRKRLAGLGSGISVQWGDITDPEAVRRALREAQPVVHMAGILPPVTDDDPELAQRINVEGTRILVELIGRAGVRIPLVYTSSIAVFGATPEALEPISVERNPVNPQEAYARTKVEAENLIKEAGLEYAILRLAPAFELDASALKLMFRLPLENRLEFCHPDDVAQAVANAVRRFPAVKGRTLIIAGGPGQRIRYRDLLGGALAVLRLPLPPQECFSYRSYCVDWYDTREAQELLEFQSRSLDDFIRDLQADLSRRLSRPVLWLTRRFIGPVFGNLVVRLLASRYGSRERCAEEGS
jgi:nucleoside-diphosphate-sugar epimerase